MHNGKIVAAWLFQKYDGRPFYATGIMVRLNSPQFSTVGVCLGKRSNARNIIEESGCSVTYLSSSEVTKIFNPALVWRLAKFLKENKVDILHCHRHKATLYGAIAARIAKIPVVFSQVHGLHRTRGMMRAMENRLLLGKVNKMIAISDAVRSDILASNPDMPIEKIITVSNSIEFDRFEHVDITKEQARKLLNLPANAFVFGIVGRLVPTKGQSYLIEAFAKVRRSLPKAHLVFIGEGKLENELKEQSARLDCLNAITFAGQRNDVPQVLRAFDCFVLPSIAEGFGCALVEAMAASLPCIASAVGGMPEVLSDKKLGYLVPAKDVDSLAAAMLDCAAMPTQQRDEMGKAACDTVERLYSHDIAVAKLEKLYKEELCKVTSR